MMASPEPDGAMQKLHTTTETPCKETSPDSKCPICLDRFRNVSYADRCFHRFCFRCILEWGKNKAECPLCKQPFSSVYHSVRSEDDFKLYELRPAENGSFGSVEGQRFRYRTTLTHERYRGGRTRGMGSSRQQEVMRFRRGLYRRGVRVRGVQDGGRSRNTSAEFFRKNPACLHRLVPWLKRELAVLYGSHDSVADVVLHVILSLITRHDMQNDAFLRELRPFLSSRTDHFLHEFLSFAKSPFNMEAYDRYAVYDCPAPSPLSALSDDDDDDADRSSAPSPWDDETPGPSYSSTSQSVFTVTISDSDQDSISEDETVRINADANANGRVDEGDHNSDDDCVIIGFIKPTVQRTPELVQLSSDSEASVQDEPVPSTSSQSDTRGLTNQRSHNADDVPSHIAKKPNQNHKKSYSSNSHRQRSRSLSYKHKRRSKATNHSSQSQTPSQAHQRHHDTHYGRDTSQPSHAHSCSKMPSFSRSNPFSRSTHACSRSRTHARSRSRSRVRSSSRTRARSGSRSRTCSKSRTHACSRSRSRARSKSRTRARLRSRSRARSGSRTRARLRSRSHARSGSRTRACLRSRSHARSGSRTRARLRSRSRARSGSRTRARLRSRSRAHSRSKARAHSGSRIHTRSGSRSPGSCYHSGRWRMQASPQNTKEFEYLPVNLCSSSHRKSSHEKPCGTRKNKSLDGERRRRRSNSREKHHHSKKKRKKKSRSSSVHIGTERRKHHKKKKKHKRKSRSERLGRSSEGSSPTDSTIHTDTDMRSAEEALPPSDSAAAHTKSLSSSHEETVTCSNTYNSSTNCEPDKSLFCNSPTVYTPL